MTDLIGRAALVTGASSGIGRSITVALARQGVRVAACSRSEKGLHSLRDDVEERGGEIMTKRLDVRDESALISFTTVVAESFGSIDILVANAGVGIFKPVIEMSAEEFYEQIDTNVKGVFLSVKAVLPSMVAGEFGDILILSSLAGKNGFATGSGYCASKFGLRGFAQSLMLEVRNRNIRVITFFPGSVDTPFFDGTGMERKDRNRERILKPEDVSEAVLHALLAPRRAMISEIDIRPSNP